MTAVPTSPMQANDLLDSSLLDLLIDQHDSVTLPHLQRLWDYYRNALTDRTNPTQSGRDYQLAQERGLPRRLTGSKDAPLSEMQRVAPGLTSEVSGAWDQVIENDIAWRIHSLVDFMFGKRPTIQSLADDPALAQRIETFLGEVLDANGGIAFFQNLALLGSIYGYVDVLLRAGSDGRAFQLDLIEAPRAIAILSTSDYRRLDAYVLHYRQLLNEVADDSFLSRVRNKVLGSTAPSRRASTQITQVWTRRSYQSFQDDRGARRELVEQSINRLGRIPVVHIQNLPQPFFYEGLSEVEPLIPLQDELNTRLSDRANRVTFQSFKMYLGKGIEHFLDRPVGPGQMWQTDNPDASIETFGGDAHSPSEEAHINEIRNAMDKTSAVTPVAAGLLRNKVGNLTSENALRITLMGLLAKTERKRVTYGVGIEQLSELILHAADVLGVLATRPEHRRIRIDWPSPLPEQLSEQLEQAKAKLAIGVSAKQVLTELGYADCRE